MESTAIRERDQQLPSLIQTTSTKTLEKRVCRCTAEGMTVLTEKKMGKEAFGTISLRHTGCLSTMWKFLTGSLSGLKLTVFLPQYRKDGENVVKRQNPF